MACPFFMPVEKLENGAWLHGHRLPLGCGWSGRCTAPGHDGESPSSEDLQSFCNLGYAEGCDRLPRDRDWDSIRFGARTVGEGKNGTGGSVQVQYVCERGHRPAGHGFLSFDLMIGRLIGRCAEPHRDARIQRMAECYLESYLEKRRRNENELVAAS